MSLGDGKKKKKHSTVKCPVCGSEATGRFMYGPGVPVDDHMKRDMERGFVRLVEAHSEPVKVDGSDVDMDPEFYCNDCGADFGIPAILMRDGTPEYMVDSLISIGFSLRGLPGEEYSVHIQRTDNGASGKYTRYAPGTSGEDEVRDVEMSETRFLKFLSALFNRIHVHEWDSGRDNTPDSGSARWSLELYFGGEYRITHCGSDLPPYFKELTELLQF